MKEKVAVFGILRFPPENITQVLPHLKKLVDETYKHDGCISYDVAEDPYDPGLIRFSELWPSQASLDAHLKATHIEPWRQAAKEFGLMERKFTAYEITSSQQVRQAPILKSNLTKEIPNRHSNRA